MVVQVVNAPLPNPVARALVYHFQNDVRHAKRRRWSEWPAPLVAAVRYILHIRAAWFGPRPSLRPPCCCGNEPLVALSHTKRRVGARRRPSAMRHREGVSGILQEAAALLRGVPLALPRRGLRGRMPACALRVAAFKPRSRVAPARSTAGTPSRTRLAAELPAATDATFCGGQSTSVWPGDCVRRGRA